MTIASHDSNVTASVARAIREALESGHDEWLRAYAADETRFTADTRNRWKGSKRAEYRRRLFAFQHGICLKCGEGMDLSAEVGHPERAEWGHMMTARRYGSERAGFRWGNVGMWHVRCNRRHGENDAFMVTLARPDLLFRGETRDLPMA